MAVAALVVKYMEKSFLSIASRQSLPIANTYKSVSDKEIPNSDNGRVMLEASNLCFSRYVWCCGQQPTISGVPNLG